MFGGPQIIEIVVDDPDRADEGDTEPDVEIDEQRVEMAQATTGKWYAYVADESSYGTSGLTANSDDTVLDTEILKDIPALVDGEAWPTAGIVQTYEFADGDDVEITAGRSESVTLSYDDHSGIATIGVDRNDVPVGGMVHVTISDFMLNLDPTADDAWTLNGDTGDFTYDSAETGADFSFGNDDTGVFGITDTNDPPVAEYSAGEKVVTFEETGSNTGVFASDENDVSEIDVSDGASSGDTFTIKYAADDQQIIVDDFDSTLELIADGTWDSSETAHH